jgi:hypothetical protein
MHSACAEKLANVFDFSPFPLLFHGSCNKFNDCICVIIFYSRGKTDQSWWRYFSITDECDATTMVHCLPLYLILSQINLAYILMPSLKYILI